MAEPVGTTSSGVVGYFNTEHLIDASELLKKPAYSNYKIIDFRKEEDYLQGHISNAINIQLTDIEDDSYPYQGMMAKKEAVNLLFSKLGIAPSDTLVVYDERSACDAARLWWVLRNYDFETVKLLNGGLHAWLALDGTVTNAISEFKPSIFKFGSEKPSMKLYADKENVLQALNNPGTVLLLDARTQDEFTGKRQKRGAARAGRIPGSKSIDWAEAVDYHNTKRFKSYNELETIYGALGVSKDHPIITYCHSGVRSAHTTYVLTELLGYTNVKNYDGSWVEWSHMEAFPIEKDSATTINQ
ncbi:sulfurtransferase [Flagellimonas meishanensis]|uniref:sulfurtransferase n=1 Tax=Flagellimonas meishanensis TaxID=2873264 RepID=UPI001CA70C2C|nr:sulfurtransferase [[Muricauda] meishanensis]